MATITKFSQLDVERIYSYADYLRWKFEERVEIIKGKVMLMSPAPNLYHQQLSGELSYQIAHYLRHKKCKLFVAPFDVKLYNKEKSTLKNKEVYNVVQPDLCVICDKTKLTQQGCDGAPEWIIEIVSKGNSKRDLLLKYALYQENGVGEYWLVYPEVEAIHQFILNKKTKLYQLHKIYAQDGFISPVLFPKLQMNLVEIFAD
ncbi:MAG: Uma2 family endonuclease [Methylococcales bacterium]|nr:Uma2 family endonuclease [Methylococcales bacterium]